MKKNFFLFFLILSNFALAQVTFTPGIRAGANFAKFTETDGGFYDMFESTELWENEERVQTSYITDFYIGVFGTIRFSKVYALQPEINYSRQGTIMKTSTWEQKSELSYLSIQAVNKFFLQKFNLQAGLSIDYLIADKNFDPYVKNNTDLGILLGAGYDITNQFGIEARFKKGLVSQIKTTSEDHTNILFQLGVYYTFK
ncbi:outer membrane beta-barrel protein [Epilithonimonas xixisoli]|uniref:Outer membrane protein with beta-barrel domain n=1 Tax=Epilithonimonas xixisoli TaxID=1476462 RepID=A0A4R8IBZ4_9FLAO|nr:outer membrane beta-barrel protein [Epilithonimonas xixisoli]TDX84891.1 outer membrane protein with beta-barrel domain [Epilithonimonas xixisoli]